MGHIVNPDKDYHRLQKRLDTMLTGAPASETFMKILKLLFTPEEAGLAWRMPTSPRTITHIARKLSMPVEALDEHVTEMAGKGLVVDLDLKGKRFVMLAPVVIGFFEYTFMRTRDDVPMKELAELFDTYMFKEKDLGPAVFQQQTQIGRSLVREEAFPEGDYTEIFDWERATRIVETASAVGISLCACRHHHTHLETACDAPLRTCMTLNLGVQPMVKAGIAEKITNKEALRILEECKEAGLAQTGDNVKNNLTYMCNCCSCCCGMMNAIRHMNIKNAIVSSNFIMMVDTDACKGCGKCAKACPVDAIEVVKEGEGKAANRYAVRDASLCLGCGVCYSACKFGAISMKPREKRVFTPEGVFEQTVAMAIERGKLAQLIFDDPEKLSHRAIAKVVGALEKSPPYRAAMAVKPLRSAFFNTIVKKAKAMTGI